VEDDSTLEIECEYRNGDEAILKAKRTLLQQPASLALLKDGFKLLEDFPTFGVDEAESDRLWWPLGFAGRADRLSRISGSNFDFVNRARPSNVANTKLLSLAASKLQ